MDNGTAFCLEVLWEMLDRWDIRQYNRAAYRPSGNGIMELNHGIIKAIAKRGSILSAETVFWYNQSSWRSQREQHPPVWLHDYEMWMIWEIRGVCRRIKWKRKDSLSHMAKQEQIVCPREREKRENMATLTPQFNDIGLAQWEFAGVAYANFFSK